MDNPTRLLWLDTMLTLARTPLEALAKRELKANMKVEMKEGADRESYVHLETLARLLVGMAPWLEGKSEGSEERLRKHYSQLAREAIDAGTDPSSPDYMNFSQGFQPIVDTAFLAQAILRAPMELWEKLDGRVKRNVVNAFKATRSRKPVFSNWLLFSAMIEVALHQMGESDWDHMRIDYAIKQMDQWYAGDGVYSDGPHFRFDYYNSFVIQPMLLDVLDAVGSQYDEWHERAETVKERSRRYAEILERLISPEGTFPPVGRSLAYRCGVFHTLAQHAWREDLPESVTPAQVRCGLTAVMEKCLHAAGTYTDDGWLTVGFYGHQPGIGEGYITNGSSYLCSLIFLPLGLPASAAFWRDEDESWTSKKAWSGLDFPMDHALKS
ncbi:DUF2264 domain-containing protein [Fictibacillus enclensis]|uniref:DUF2264 domain-containing protein n=1 Tax=Fictibacillus enclensis TaxID=1017270 RepID=UPI0025A123BB|nr:DUF2264 domain-containing protein [Fictibacillus enclensis]MDM5340372.1 DUF2264 domain-containing protein [Fictibacillus enclensis]